MSTEQYIAVAEFCKIYHTDIAFIEALEEFGLIEITIQREGSYLNNDQLPQLEQFLRMHEELDINPAGIDAINNILQRVEHMQNEIRELKNRLSQFED